MPRSSVRATASGLALALGAAAPAHALDINPVLTTEVLVEGITQRNYTDANASDYVWVDPDVYAGWSAGLVPSTTPGYDYQIGNLQVDPDTWQLVIPERYRTTHYQDNVNQMWLRASLGTKVEVANRAELKVSFVFDAEGGDRTHRGEPGSNRGEIYLNEGWIHLKDIYDNLSLKVGRQDFRFNLRPGRPGFLYDSMADNPKAYGLDGARAYYKLDTFTFYPFAFILDSTREERGIEIEGVGLTNDSSSSKDNWLAGLQAEWKPLVTGDQSVVFHAGISLEKNVVVREPNPLAGRPDPLIGDGLINYDAGLLWEIPVGSTKLTLYGEGVLQDGTVDTDQDFGGYGYTVGMDWRVGGRFDASIGAQWDFLSGDRQAAGGIYDQILHGDLIAPTLSPFTKTLIGTVIPQDPNDTTYRNFVAPLEGVSDTFIVEHERYGELSELLVGNLMAAKGWLEYRLDDNITLKALGAWYGVDAPAYRPGAQAADANYFGQEYDLRLQWRFARHTDLSLMAGMFRPGLGYRQVAAREHPNSRALPEDMRRTRYQDTLIHGGPTALSTLIDLQYPQLTADDDIIFAGINLHIWF